MAVSAASEIPEAGDEPHQSSLHQNIGRNSGLPLALSSAQNSAIRIGVRQTGMMMQNIPYYKRDKRRKNLMDVSTYLYPPNM